MLKSQQASEICRQEKLQHEHSLYSIQRQLRRLRLQLAESEARLRRIDDELKHFRAQIAQYRKVFKAYALPELNGSITDPNLQQHAYWQQEAMNDLRSKVFIKAMQLHEAWLREVRSIKLFYRRIEQLKDCITGKTQDESAIELWRIVFMFVPVISTTFASLGRMFAPIPENTFGWLLIDEAGQAIPQAAVGGLLRFRKTIVVGDPWQIEPVFTSPPALVNYLMTSALGDTQEQWTPFDAIRAKIS
ncbi:AAA domain-containing protein [Vibrio sp. PP-XX7]